MFKPCPRSARAEGGLAWEISYGLDDLILLVVGDTLYGDYNDDGTVTLPTTRVITRSPRRTSLDNDLRSVVDRDDYLYWKAHSRVARPSATSTGRLSDVPEPNVAVLLLLEQSEFRVGVVAIILLPRRRRIAVQRRPCRCDSYNRHDLHLPDPAFCRQFR